MAETQTAQDEPKTIETMSFEEALAELEGIVQRLERGQLELEASIDAYERGTLLKKHCAERLRQARLRVDQLNVDADGNVETSEFPTN
ncbi:MAG: exodeoxyribonuclease VII small subunit [Pseudomonadota bacterium]